MKEFKLPDPGEGLVEAEIVTWRVAVGDEVKINDIVVEVETSKSLVELPIPFAGRVVALLAAEGEMVDVGSPIITIDDGTEPAPEARAPLPELVEGRGDDMVPTIPDSDENDVDSGAVHAATPGGRVPVLVGYGAKTTEAKRRPRRGGDVGPAEPKPATSSVFSTTEPVSRHTDRRAPLQPDVSAPVGQPLPRPGSAVPYPAEAEPTNTGSQILAKPPVRKLAKDLGVDLGTVAGSGLGGVITRDDVQAAAAPLPEPVEGPVLRQAQEALAKGPAEDIRIPIKGVRKMTADAMVASAFTAPHVTEWITCDVSATMELVERLKLRREFREIKISPLLIVAKAVCLALVRNPQLNSSWDAAANEIVIKGSVNLGIAAATPRGLVVPNIKNAGGLTLVDLATAFNELVAVAKSGRTQPADMSQGSFTITNVGVFGVDTGTPILNPGESGILAFGAISRRPWVVGTGADERIEPRWVTNLAVSFDHRVVDGEQGSKFLADVAAFLTDPALAMLV